MNFAKSSFTSIEMNILFFFPFKRENIVNCIAQFSNVELTMHPGINHTW